MKNSKNFADIQIWKFWFSVPVSVCAKSKCLPVCVYAWIRVRVGTGLASVGLFEPVLASSFYSIYISGKTYKYGNRISWRSQVISRRPVSLWGRVQLQFSRVVRQSLNVWSVPSGKGALSSISGSAPTLGASAMAVSRRPRVCGWSVFAQVRCGQRYLAKRNPSSLGHGGIQGP